MPMSQRHRDHLKDCNCMVRWDGSWSPARKADDAFYSPGGRRIPEPKEWRAMSSDEIIREMDEGGWVPLFPQDMSNSNA